MFGGRTLAEKNVNSYRWYIKSEDAVELAVFIQDYSPSRAEAIAAFQNWINTEDLAERVVIAREFNEAARTEQTSALKEKYKDLVKNPLFVAGIFESRGLLFSRKRGDQTLDPVIIINSENVQLLEAIKEKYGGGISLATDNSRTLSIGREATKAVLQIITPHLISPISEYQKVAE